MKTKLEVALFSGEKIPTTDRLQLQLWARQRSVGDHQVRFLGPMVRFCDNVCQDNNQDAHQDNALRLMERAMISDYEARDTMTRVESLAIPHCSGFTESQVHCAKPVRAEPVSSSNGDCVHLPYTLKPASCSLRPILSVLFLHVSRHGRWDYDQILHLQGLKFELSLRHYTLWSACLAW